MPVRKAQRKARDVVAVSPFVVDVDGEEVFVHAGDHFPSSSKVVKGREGLFVDAVEHVQRDGLPPAA